MRISPTYHSWPASNGNAAASAAESMVLNCSRAAATSELPVTIPDDQPKLQPGTRRHLGRPVGNSNSTRDTGRSTYDSVGSGKGVNMGTTTVAAGIKGKPQPHPRQANRTVASVSNNSMQGRHMRSTHTQLVGLLPQPCWQRFHLKGNASPRGNATDEPRGQAAVPDHRHVSVVPRRCCWGTVM